MPEWKCPTGLHKQEVGCNAPLFICITHMGKKLCNIYDSI